MVKIRARGNKFEARAYVPKEVQSYEEGRSTLYKTLTKRDRKSAMIEAEAWEASLKARWFGITAPEDAPRTTLRTIYQSTVANTLREPPRVYRGNEDPVVTGIEFELERLEAEIGEGNEPSPAQAAMIAGLNDAIARHRGAHTAVPQSLEQSFSELAAERMTVWARDPSLKEANTASQREATYRLYSSYCNDRPIREVTSSHVARFHDQLKGLNPAWPRSPAARSLSWTALQEAYGGHPTGLSASTMNRHMRTLAELWEWAEVRDLCTGRNPFKGYAQKVKAGRNQQPYLPWEPRELKRLLIVPPKRQDLRELIFVGMFTGMRIDEIASLTKGQIRTEDGIPYIQINSAKTPAGQRKVPLHPKLSWLAAQGEVDSDEPVWPNFNGEGPAKKRGADAGKEFSRFKLARGFTSRAKAFHSFRKNVTQQMENARVPENEWGQLIGHEYGFTFTVYNPTGITLKRKAEIMALIKYPDLDLSAYVPVD